MSLLSGCAIRGAARARSLRSWRNRRGARRGSWRYCGSITLVDQILQFLAGLEEWNLFSRYLDALAGLGVPAHARFALAGGANSQTPGPRPFVPAPRTPHRG